MSTHSLSLLPISCHRNPNDPASPLLLSLHKNGLFSSLIGQKLSIQSSHSRLVVSTRYRSTVATVLLSLPTACVAPTVATGCKSCPTARKPERTSSEKVPKWSARAIKSFSMAELEARKLKYPNTGTEALLMGILVEGTSLAAKFLRANGITLFKVREETVNLLGKSDLYFFSPEHPPLTEPAQRALDWAVDEKIKSGSVQYLFLDC
ncbi:ATP-dependent Clp protease ATP-binding subunit CLPT1, chloroplastic [Vitis vinifera]|uniref:ATP-dependent Clp protease ATP-binding subunit CLPT1, chloroplastic n=1 Tax=Vitis vinifera TaxID=29760 RepID=A0A438EE81_VITVI|nr:ATP-dependent Clp protease ATP-binding subunit CLPT1, chloroplastic [Vitis vinifera]